MDGRLDFPMYEAFSDQLFHCVLPWPALSNALSLTKLEFICKIMAEK